MSQRGGVGGFRLAMELKGAGRADKRAERVDGRARLDAADGLLRCIGLATAQCPRICSVISNPRRAKWLPKLSIKVIP